MRHAFQQLEDELLRTKARRFHRMTIVPSFPIVPSDGESQYEAFIRACGGAAAFFRRRNSSLISVLDPNHRMVSGINRVTDGFWVFGVSQGDYAYFQKLDQTPHVDGPVFVEEHTGRIKLRHGSFADWFDRSLSDAKSSYSADELVQHAYDPVPFTDAESAIVDARSRYEWKLKRSDEWMFGSKLTFLVTNHAAMALPYISVDLTDEAGCTQRTFLNTSGLAPGSSAEIQANSSFKGTIQTVDPPPPLPEDKECYREFW